MFEKAKEIYNPNHISIGNILAFITNKRLFITYSYCILIGLPTWFIVGIIVQRSSSHFASYLQIQGDVYSNRCVVLFYLGVTFGDIASGLMSQKLKSRLKPLNIFTTFALLLLLIYLFLMKGASNKSIYTLLFFMGVGMGYWTVFVTIAAESFGTNLRATAAVTVPNLARGFLVPITGIFTWLTP